MQWLPVSAYFFYQFIANVVLLYVLYTFSNRVIRKNRHRRKSALRIIVGSMIICCLLSPVLSQLQWFLISLTDKETGFNFFLSFNFVKDVVLGVMMLFETGIRYSTFRRHQTMITNQELMKENIKTRYEALKNQLDPHFLFNSLNTLNGLIGMDDEKAHEYVENLSSVFRYTLHSKSICTLNEEIEFVNAYIDLLKIRYGENLVVHYNIEEKYKYYYLMPVSIQLLVENVIKHNTISAKKPLFILIETTENDSIKVENLVNPKLKDASEGGVGLANLAKRYSILFQKQISITQKEGTFTVEIPLISQINEQADESSNRRRRDCSCASLEQTYTGDTF